MSCFHSAYLFEQFGQAHSPLQQLLSGSVEIGAELGESRNLTILVVGGWNMGTKLCERKLTITEGNTLLFHTLNDESVAHSEHS